MRERSAADVRVPARAGRHLARALDDRVLVLVAVNVVVLVLGSGSVLRSPGAEPVTTVGQVPRVTAPITATPPAPTDPAAVVAEVVAPVPAAPVAVRLERIEVDAPLVDVGLRDDGAMEVPDDVDVVGWYDPDGIGVVPGAPGTAVLAGHVDSRLFGRGAFHDLRLLEVGDAVEVEHADGSITRWVVSGRAAYPKDVLPIADLFVWSGTPRLALITCGGTFDRAVGSYTENVVVLAVPA